MQKYFLALSVFFFCSFEAFADYNDHRGHNVDSLEAVVAPWTSAKVASASEAELIELSVNWRNLMLGYKQTNGVKMNYYARKALELGQRKDWKITIYDSAKSLGEQYWAKENYDSAAVYYGIALHAIERMEVVPEEEVVIGRSYSQLEKDDALSSMYGTMGNFYSIQDSLETAFAYYGKALDIFKQYGWLNSCAVCYYNMGETSLGAGDLKSAKQYYNDALNYAKQANDSLWIAESLRGLGQLYMTKGNTMRAMRCLDEADKYFSAHEDEELRARLETLDFTGQVLRMQKRSLKWGIAALVFSLLLVVSLLFVRDKLKRVEKVQKETVEVLDETLEEMRPAEETRKPEIKLNDREVAILKLLSTGKTTPQIADEICLSPETVKWYRKKLLVKFDATSSAELMKKAMEMGTPANIRGIM